jgi:hypothetical protein
MLAPAGSLRPLERRSRLLLKKIMYFKTGKRHMLDFSDEDIFKLKEFFDSHKGRSTAKTRFGESKDGKSRPGESD